MITLDTHVLVRYIVQDDARQAAPATALIEDELTTANPGFVTLIALVELSWVLRRLYRCSAAQISQIAIELVNSPTLVVESAEAVSAAANAAHADLADMVLHEVGRLRGSTHTVTFDHDFARIDGVERLG